MAIATARNFHLPSTGCAIYKFFNVCVWNLGQRECILGYKQGGMS